MTKDEPGGALGPLDSKLVCLQPFYDCMDLGFGFVYFCF